MLNESFRMMKETIKETIQERKEKKILEQRQKQYVQDIVAGKFPELFISDTKIAEIIVQWCDKEENPVEFFLQCLSKMGVQTPIKIANVTENSQYYSLVMKESNNEKIWGLYISKTLKDFLRLEIVLDEKVYFNVRGYEPNLKSDYKPILEIQKGEYSVTYYSEEIIEISVGNEISIKFEGIAWKQKEKLYTKELIEDLKSLDKNLDPYSYYTEVKEKIARYYDLESVEIELSMKSFSMTTQDGKLIDYKDSIEGITIKNYNQWSYKEYCTEKQKVVWENDKIKIEGVPDLRIQYFIIKAKKAIREVEESKY